MSGGALIRYSSKALFGVTSACPRLPFESRDRFQEQIAHLHTYPFTFHYSNLHPQMRMLSPQCASILILLAAMSQLIGLLTAFHHARTSSKC